MASSAIPISERPLSERAFVALNRRALDAERHPVIRLDEERTQCTRSRCWPDRRSRRQWRRALRLAGGATNGASHTPLEGTTSGAAFFQSLMIPT